MDTPYLVFSNYILHAMTSAEINLLDDGTFAGRIPLCQGVFAFGKDRNSCILNLQSTLESWILIGLKLGHAMPIIRGINLNQEPVYARSN